MGEEYPATFLLGELTAPKRAPSHSLLRVSSVRSGSAAPSCSKAPKPTGSWTKEKSRLKDLERDSKTRRPACERKDH